MLPHRVAVRAMDARNDDSATAELIAAPELAFREFCGIMVADEFAHLAPCLMVVRHARQFTPS